MPRDNDNERRAAKKQKFKVFDQSGMTEADRRALRQQQRALREELKAGEHGSLEELSEARGQNNEVRANNKVSISFLSYCFILSCSYIYIILYYMVPLFYKILTFTV